MNKLFALPHLAKLAEENDFDEECMAYFTLVTEKLCYAVSNVKKQDVYKDYTLAPLWQQLVDWFREKHGKHVQILFVKTHYTILTYGWVLPIEVDNKFNSYYEALTKALEEAFKLIKK